MNLKVKPYIFYITIIGLIFTSCSQYLDNTNYIFKDRPGINIFFTDPNSYTNSSEIEDRIVNLIQVATSSIYMAMYTFSSYKITYALLEAYYNGLDIKIVGDASQYFTDGYQDLLNNGLDIYINNYKGIMHNKFIIVDDTILWLGTGNFSYTDLYYNNNSFIMINSRYLVQVYLAEFFNLYDGILDSYQDATDRVISWGNSSIEVLFSPNEGEEIIDKIIENIEEAKESIYYMIFSFTDEDIANSLLYTSQRGVSVYGVHDSGFFYHPYDQGRRLWNYSKNLSMEVHIDNNVLHGGFGNRRLLGGKMHCKTLIIDYNTDNPIVITGSFNWSQNAVYNNNENIMIIKDKEVANIFYEGWKEVWQSSRIVVD